MSSPASALTECCEQVEIGPNASQCFEVHKPFEIYSMFGQVSAQVGDLIVITPKGLMVISDRIKHGN